METIHNNEVEDYLMLSLTYLFLNEFEKIFPNEDKSKTIVTIAYDTEIGEYQTNILMEAGLIRITKENDLISHLFKRLNQFLNTIDSVTVRDFINDVDDSKFIDDVVFINIVFDINSLLRKYDRLSINFLDEDIKNKYLKENNLEFLLDREEETLH